MKTIRLLCLLASILVISTNPVPIQGQSNASASEAQKREAQLVWDGMIKAKGGREKLHSIQNVLLTGLTEAGSPYQVYLFVFPNRYWEWNIGWGGDNQIMRFYLGDGENSFFLTRSGLEQMTNDRGSSERLEDTSALYLLETSSWKPEIVGVTSRREANKTLNVVQTIVGRARTDYTIDDEEMLVRKIEIFYPATNSKPLETWVFSNYTRVDGIQMPGFETGFNSRGRKNAELKLVWKFNVDYDQNLFVKFPPLSAGPNAWRLPH